MTGLDPNAPGREGEKRLVLAAVAALGLGSVMTQLALMRELLGSFGGNELLLGIVLSNWLLLTGIGAGLAHQDDLRQRHQGHKDLHPGQCAHG